MIRLTRSVAFLSLGMLILSPVACVAEEEGQEVEAVGSDYELLLADRDAARCLERPLRADDDGRARCRLIELRRDAECRCDDGVRLAIDDAERLRIDAARDRDPDLRDFDCACELRQLEGERLRACLDADRTPVDLRGERVDGWCYLDAEREPAIGSRTACDECDDGRRRLIRFEGAAELREDARLLARCD
jgi:hypothetical protein